MNKLEIWIRFLNEADYKSKEEELHALFSEKGETVCIYLDETKEVKRLPKRKMLNQENCNKVKALVGENNVKIVTKEKDLESKRSINFPDTERVSLERVADILESINGNLADTAEMLEDISRNLNSCISRSGNNSFLCITGNVSTN